MAAILSCGGTAALSHSSAGVFRQIGEERAGVIEISVPAHANPKGADDLVIHRRAALERDLDRHLGIPVTSPVLTLIDLATFLPPHRLERAVNKADKLDLIDPTSLRLALDERKGQPGVPALRTLLDRHTFVLTDSELERRFMRIARAVGLPIPITQADVNGYRVDFFWPDLGLVVETGGLRYHRTPAQQARDRLRDQAHTAAGLTPLRFTHAQIRWEPACAEAVLARVARRLPGR